jgi:hypothetical protein
MSTKGYPFPVTFTNRETPWIDMVVIGYSPGDGRTLLLNELSVPAACFPRRDKHQPAREYYDSKAGKRQQVT